MSIKSNYSNFYQLHEAVMKKMGSIEDTEKNAKIEKRYNKYVDNYKSILYGKARDLFLYLNDQGVSSSGLSYDIAEVARDLARRDLAATRWGDDDLEIKV